MTSKRRGTLLIVLASLLLISSCSSKGLRNRIPSEVEATVAAIGEDISLERYDKVYEESSELWKKDATPERSAEVLKNLRAKLGKVENRSVHSAIEQQNSGGALKGHAFIISYQTKFERGEAMEIFTLIEENGSWKLARYLVNSTALQ